MSDLFDDLDTNLEQVEAAPAPVKEIKRKATMKEAAKPEGEKWYTILLEENDDIPPTGQFFQLNGKPYILQPGKKVSVPEGIISILNDAVTSTPIMDGSNTVIGYRDRLRFPYRPYGETPA